MEHKKWKKEEFRALSPVEIARLAGVVWIYGSIDIEKQPEKDEKGNIIKCYYYPRIMITMPIPLPYHYWEDVSGEVLAGEDGTFTLEIERPPELVKTRLAELQPYMSGEEAVQIGLALEVFRTKESSLLTEPEKQQKLEELYQDLKRSQARLERWIEKFVEAHKDEEKGKVPSKIWKTYAWFKFMKKYGYKLTIDIEELG